MAKDDHSGHLSSVLASVSQLLQEAEFQGMIIGGIAASILGRPRYTNDVDLVILDLDNRIAEAVGKCNAYGITPRISDFEKFAQESRMLLMRHTPSGINVDISMGLLPFEREAVLRSRPVFIEGFAIPLPTPEDLIILKSISSRPVDQEDIKAILNKHPGLKRNRILSVVREFSEVLEQPDLLKKIESLFSER